MKLDKSSKFFHDKPLFGMDIGLGSVKVMQLADHRIMSGQDIKSRVIGFGSTTFSKNALNDGLIIDVEIIAEAIYDMFKHKLVGDITTKRVALSIPTSNTLTRSLISPYLSNKEVLEAVKQQADRYIHLPLDELYLDYSVIKRSDVNHELLIVATPQNIVNSYMDLALVLGLDVVLIEPAMMSNSRLLSLDNNAELPTLIIDFGNLSSDLSIRNGQILASKSIQGGGDSFTELIKKALKLEKHFTQCF
jgi:type IV pilus assembly protein PilM